jgi:Na+/H+ antiporter NhaD/arsenite permease-like protein
VTSTGAATDVIVVGAGNAGLVAALAARDGSPIGFWQFTRYGLVIAGATLVVSSGYVWLRYFALG